MKPLSQEEFVKLEGLRCPACASDEVRLMYEDSIEESDIYETAFSYIQLNMKCGRCHATWCNNWNLAEYVGLVIPAEEGEAIKE